LAEAEHCIPHFFWGPADGEVIPSGNDTDAVEGEDFMNGGPVVVGSEVIGLLRDEEVGRWGGTEGLIANGKEGMGIQPLILVLTGAVQVGVIGPCRRPLYLRGRGRILWVG